MATMTLVLVVVSCLLVLSLFALSLTWTEWQNTKSGLDSWKESALKYRQAMYDLEDDHYGVEAIKAENDRLKKAASKLIIQVAEAFGKEVTKPPKQGS